MAMPQILSQLGQSNPMVGQFRQAMGMLRGVQNPQAYIRQMISQNPVAQQMLNALQQSGTDPKTAFYNLARQKGLDPDSLMQGLM